MTPLMTTTVRLSGHLIDSLTLTKVIDIILAHDADYRLNHIEIGSRKKDFTDVVLTIQSADDRQLQKILEEIAPHGAHPLAEENANWLPAPADACLPAGGFIFKHLPTAVRIAGQSIPLLQQEEDGLVLVLDEAAKAVRLKYRSEVQAGEPVLVGHQGLVW
ncbi:MAG: hypothetical protein SFZ03_10570 [Candidatus Melainabacteria bacterium]|nr:hypothetical protein [Candidatus Melainabacteria bacterium]